MNPAVYMFHVAWTEVGEVMKPGNPVIGTGWTVTYDEQPVVKEPVKRAQSSWPTPSPSSRRGELSLRAKNWIGLVVTPGDIPVNTHVVGFLPDANPAFTK